jgi:hypothetical protein
MNLSELDYANDQQVFDYVLEKLREQGCQSKYADRCLYRGPNGLKCAAGHLIPDDEYDEKMEDGLLNGPDSVFNNSLVNSYFLQKGVNIDLLARLQSVHDNYWDTREERFEHLAKEFNFTYQGQCPT